MERPILFSSEMVKALLAGAKSQTRRVIRPQLLAWHGFTVGAEIERGFFVGAATFLSSCPYGRPGDILWVRETWRVGAWNEHIGAIAVDYKADGFARKEWIPIEDEEVFERYWIQSTDDAMDAGLETDENGRYHWTPGSGPTRWRSPLHMPRKVARLFLQVKNVRVERVQDITEEDARAEGIPALNGFLLDHAEEWCKYTVIAANTQGRERPTVADWIGGFAYLWDRLNAKRGYGWQANPWVWVIEFETMRANH